jgi:hypothetical protein
LRGLPTLVALFMMPGTINADELEYKVKAAFLYNFSKFVEWTNPLPEGQPFVIGIVGDDPFGDLLEHTIRDKTVSGRSLVVRRYANVKQLRPSQILFVSASERHRFAPILEAVEGAGTLTVSEIEAFAALGGMINFVIEENKIRFEINPEATARAGLQVNAQLLKLARVVRERTRAE